MQNNYFFDILVNMVDSRSFNFFCTVFCKEKEHVNIVACSVIVSTASIL